MTKKQKTPLSKFYILLIIVTIIPLCGFFVYATQFQTTFFLSICAALVIIIISLISYHQRLSKKRSLLSIEKEEFFEKSNLMRSEIEHEWTVINSLHRKIQNYGALKDLTEKLSLSLSLEDTSETLTREISKLFPHHDATNILYLFQSLTGELGISSSQKGQMHINIKSKKGDLFDRWLVKNLQALHVEDVKKDFRFDVEKEVSEDSRPIRSVISVPLLLGTKALGILRVDSPKANMFTTEDLRLLTTIADLASIAIENAQLYEKVEDLAIKDGLTDLYLRRYLTERMDEELPRALRSGQAVSFLMIDLDFFKKYNDEFGHMAGDMVLKMIAQLLKEYFVGPGYVVSRYGGEEFSVLLPNCSPAEAENMAELFRGKVEETTIEVRRQNIHVTVSIGLASFPKDAKVLEDLIQKADDALYQAKHLGRNQVYVSGSK